MNLNFLKPKFHGTLFGEKLFCGLFLNYAGCRGRKGEEWVWCCPLESPYRLIRHAGGVWHYPWNSSIVWYSSHVVRVWVGVWSVVLFAGKHPSARKKVFSKICICLHDCSWEYVFQGHPWWYEGGKYGYWLGLLFCQHGTRFLKMRLLANLYTYCVSSRKPVNYWTSYTTSVVRISKFYLIATSFPLLQIPIPAISVRYVIPCPLSIG